MDCICRVSEFRFVDITLDGGARCDLPTLLVVGKGVRTRIQPIPPSFAVFPRVLF